MCYHVSIISPTHCLTLLIFGEIKYSRVIFPGGISHPSFIYSVFLLTPHVHELFTTFLDSAVVFTRYQISSRSRFGRTAQNYAAKTKAQ